MPRRPRPASRNAPKAKASSPVLPVDEPELSDEHSEASEDGEAEDADAPRVVQWEDEAEGTSSEDEEDTAPPTLNSLEQDLSALPLGALVKAQRALKHAEVSEDEDEMSSSDEEEPDLEPSQKGKGKELKPEWSTKPRHDIPKRTSKHAPTEVTSKRPVTRRRIVVESDKIQPRDPRFLSFAGQLAPEKFQHNYGFLADSHKTELQTLRENLKLARKRVASSPRDLREEREAEVQRLERAVKRTESLVNQDRKGKIDRDALAALRETEKAKQKDGKKAWWMKTSEKKEVIMRARYEALASEGGSRAVKKAIEKKQRKIGQKEKKSRPFGKGLKRVRNDEGVGRITTMSASWEDDSDIFRGEPPQRSPSPTPSSQSSASRFGRLGAIAAVVELAISRWAKNESSSDSSSSSSSSHSRRTKSVFEISSRIALFHAREHVRQIPRHFALYLPPSLAHGEPICRTTDLSSILTQLHAMLQKPSTRRRQRLDYMLPDQLPNRLGAPSRAASFTDLTGLAKGKHKEANRPMPKAWFLEVSSPTWDDLSAIGKLLHLHPLTLEDILVKDDREKVEHFDKLGYYFLSFKAIKSWDAREMEGDEDSQGSVAESNIYLVVFKEGVCCFSFTDVSEHTDRVRSRLLRLDSAANMTSDWIAHGILDSVVDSFFPFLANGLEKEVMLIENIVFSATDFPAVTSEPSHSEKSEVSEKNPPLVELDEKSLARLERIHLHPHRSSLMVNLRFPNLRWRWWSRPPKSRIKPNTSTLHRMARVRRLVTSLARLLSAKGEVVAQLRKRLLTPPHGGSPTSESIEVAIYFGDVQDHIITLETSLAHYERMLSQSHPLYISQVRTAAATSKGGTDKALVYLTGVSIGVLCIQTIQGVFSINVTIPRNALNGHRYSMFAIVLCLDVLILAAFAQLLYYWWDKAKKRKPASL
ncbi:hypothetical protein MIND_00482100 [Mycena indigotica]|uniref:Ribosomal RNA-processing protein 36 n=1 Tax=Mycena indigotica TaxID=2126181 RepID=A0A8H6SYC7_9AGAR|nr:uncharacterized protein MIND_00482100 [Mycena indigotica]KAF7306896.1 hypothetical protein MIND_00482100 [Mycena indigotica]